VIAWGAQSNGVCDVPALPVGLTYVDVAAKQYHSVALRSNGTVIRWGWQVLDEPPIPAGLTCVQVAAGGYADVGRLNDGSIIEWPDHGDVPPLPPGLRYVDVAAGTFHFVAHRSDGSLVSWGQNQFGEGVTPAAPVGFEYTGVDAAEYCTMVLMQPTFQITPFCFGDGSGAACPCGNTGFPHHGCDNSLSTGGAILVSEGNAILSRDTLLLTSSGELPGASSAFLQADVDLAPRMFGDGLSCMGGHLKRLYFHVAPGGAVAAPQGSDASVSVRSAALGDPIAPGTIRVYQVAYRDSSTSFCNSTPNSMFNASNGLRIAWGP
jgi:hypothetical protein